MGGSSAVCATALHEDMGGRAKDLTSFLVPPGPGNVAA